jgi:hypothetical protein
MVCSTQGSQPPNGECTPTTFGCLRPIQVGVDVTFYGRVLSKAGATGGTWSPCKHGRPIRLRHQGTSAAATPRRYACRSDALTMSRAIAVNVSSTRSRTSSFWKTLLRCFFTVSSLMPSTAATSALRRPAAT